MSCANMIHVVDFEKTSFSTPFRGVLSPFGPQISAERGSATQSLAPGKRGWRPTSAWPLFSRPTPHASRLTLHAPRLTPHQRVQAGHRPSPAGYCLQPTAELAKTVRGPISTSGPSIFSMSPKFSMLPNQAISSDKSIRFSPLAAARSLTIRARPEALNARGSRRAGRMPISRSACSHAVAQENTVHGRTGRILGVR
jgi:hypothetical protein